VDMQCPGKCPLDVLRQRSLPTRPATAPPCFGKAGRQTSWLKAKLKSKLKAKLKSKLKLS